MRRPAASDIVLNALGLLLLTVPLLGKDIWSWRPFLIFQVEFELALGIWLLSGLAKPLAWLTGRCHALACSAA